MTENCGFRVGQEFNSLDHLKKNVKAWAISNSRNFRVIESEPTKYVIQCTNAEEKGCEWRMRAIMTATGAFRIVRYKEHKQDCSGHYSDDHPLLTSDFVADLIVDMIRVDPAFKVKSVVNFVNTKYGFVITYKRAWLAKNKAITKVFGDWDKSFEELPRYL
jgi:MuDR family transposase